MLERITPVLLTLNEKPNIARALDRLDWADAIVVVDSGSSDGTWELLRQHPKVRAFQRSFDDHAQQWSFAITSTGIVTEWILALDADYILPGEFVAELQHLRPDPDVGAYAASFRYCIHGRPLRASLYPPVNVLFRRVGAIFRNDGHTQRVEAPGRVESLRSRIDHDDRKPLRDWIASQYRYAGLEAGKILHLGWSKLGASGRVRWLGLGPFVVLPYCLLVKGLLLDGRAGLHYSIQRLIFESILWLKLREPK